MAKNICLDCGCDYTEKVNPDDTKDNRTHLFYDEGIHVQHNHSEY